MVGWREYTTFSKSIAYFFSMNFANALSEWKYRKRKSSVHTFVKGEKWLNFWILFAFWIRSIQGQIVTFLLPSGLTVKMQRFRLGSIWFKMQTEFKNSVIACTRCCFRSVSGTRKKEKTCQCTILNVIIIVNFKKIRKHSLLQKPLIATAELQSSVLLTLHSCYSRLIRVTTH